MTREQTALPCPPRTRDASRPIAPVLIRVPALATTTRARRPGLGRRPSAMRRGPVRRRRRLRREVRLIGSALLMGLPLTWALLTLGVRVSSPVGVSAPPRPAEVPGAAFAAADDLPVLPMAISIRPVTADRDPRDDAPPVVLPDYVLPDDGSEEPAHAGS